MSARSFLCVTAVLSAVTLAGCTAGAKPRPSTPPTAMRLVAFDSCAQLRDDLRAAAAASVGPYGFPGAGGFGEVIAGGARTAMDSAGAAVPAAEKAVPFSG